MNIGELKGQVVLYDWDKKSPMERQKMERALRFNDVTWLPSEEDKAQSQLEDEKREYGR